ncbi:MAG: hypothetical protein ABL974_13350 [Prosthecobacter sp.]
MKPVFPPGRAPKAGWQERFSPEPPAKAGRGPPRPTGPTGADGPLGPAGAIGPPGEVTNSSLDAAISGTSANSYAVATLEIAVSDPPTQAEVQQVLSKLNELIMTLRRPTASAHES